MHKKLLATLIAATLTAPAWADADEVLNSLQWSGLLQLEAAFSEPENGKSSNDFSVATVEIGLLAPINDWLTGEIVFLYEQDATDFGVDSATLSIAPPNALWFVNAGLFAQPFGRFDTNLVSDPLTLEIGELYETALQAGIKRGDFTASAYVFNGDSDKGDEDKLDNFGLDVGYNLETDTTTLSIAAGYLNNLGDTDALQDSIANPIADYVPGWFFSANAGFGGFNLIAEYVAAGDAFSAAELDWQGTGAQPQAWSVEAAYSVDLAGKETTFALGYQTVQLAVEF